MQNSETDPAQIRLAYLERNGDISVIPFKGEPRVLDVSVRTPLSASPLECAGAPCVLLAQVGDEAVELLDSERAALYLPVDSSDTTVVLVAAPTSSRTAWTAATSLVSSLHERPIP